MWFLVYELLFIGNMKDTNGAACVEHVRLHRPPCISRPKIISMSSFAIFLHIWNVLPFELWLCFTKFDLETNTIDKRSQTGSTV